MKARTRIVAGILEAAALLVAVYFEPSYAVRGHLHGEAFFDGKPTSWWRGELENWEGSPRPGGRLPYHYKRNPTRFEDTWGRVSDYLRTDQGIDDENAKLFLEGLNGGPCPSLLNGDATSQPVLRALLHDPSPKIRRFARIGLGMDDGTAPCER